MLHTYRAGNKHRSSDNDQQEKVFDLLETISVGHHVGEKIKTLMKYLYNV